MFKYCCSHQLSAYSWCLLFSSQRVEQGRCLCRKEGGITKYFGVIATIPGDGRKAWKGEENWRVFFSPIKEAPRDPFLNAASLLRISLQGCAGSCGVPEESCSCWGLVGDGQCVSRSLLVPQKAHWGEREKGEASRAGPGVPQWQHCSGLGGSQPWHHASC